MTLLLIYIEPELSSDWLNKGSRGSPAWQKKWIEFLVSDLKRETNFHSSFVEYFRMFFKCRFDVSLCNLLPQWADSPIHQQAWIYIDLNYQSRSSGRGSGEQVGLI